MGIGAFLDNPKRYMKDQESSDFKLGEDKEDADCLFQSEMENLRIDKLSQRLTFVSVFLPIIIGLPIVVCSKWANSSGRCHGTRPLSPIQWSNERAYIKEIIEWYCASLRGLVVGRLEPGCWLSLRRLFGSGQ